MSEPDPKAITEMSEHISKAALIARLLLPLDKDAFLDLCSAAFEVVAVKENDFRKELNNGK